MNANSSVTSIANAHGKNVHLINVGEQLCLQLDQSDLPAHPLNRRDHRPRFPRHAFRTAVSDNGKQLLLILVI